MLRKSTLVIFVLLALSMGFAAACGGGGGGSSAPSQVDGGGDDGTDGAGEGEEDGPAGDPSDPPVFRVSGSFPEFDSPVVSVDTSSDRIYVATQENVFAFNRQQEQIAVAEALPPTPLVDVEVTPNLVSPLADGSNYPFPEYPVIQGQPGSPPNTGIRILAPNLDATTNIGDQGETEAKFFDLPRHYFSENRLAPNVTQPPNEEPWFCIVAMNGLEVLGDGSILAAAAIDDCRGTMINPNTIILMDPRREGSFFGRFRAYFPGEQETFDDEGQSDRPEVLETPFFPGGPYQLGGANPSFPMRFAMGTAEDRGEVVLREFLFEDNVIERDFMGRTNLTVDKSTVPFGYTFDPPATNRLGFQNVLGTGIGSSPGEFASQGVPEDPRTQGGGPAGATVNERTGEIFVADPGNRRVQVFNQNGEHIRSLGTGQAGETGANLTAPIDVEVDEFTGAVYVVDQNRVRVFERVNPNTEFGNVVGLVENVQTTPDSPLSQASVTLRDSFGVLASNLTGADGTYEFNNLPISSYTVVASKSGFQPDQGRVNLIPDDTVRLDLRLEPVTGGTTGGVQGFVTAVGSNLPVEGATIRILGTSLETQTGDDGSFSLNDIQAGEYQISVEADGFETAVRDLFISERTTQQMTFRLQPVD